MGGGSAHTHVHMQATWSVYHTQSLPLETRILIKLGASLVVSKLQEGSCLHPHSTGDTGHAGLFIGHFPEDLKLDLLIYTGFLPTEPSPRPKLLLVYQQRKLAASTSFLQIS